MKIYILGLAGLLGLGVFSSCNKFLDTLPDDRIELTGTDSEVTEKVRKLMISAYQGGNYITTTVLSADNVMEMQDNISYGSLFSEELYNWKAPTQDKNESPLTYWEDAYASINTANTAIQLLDQVKDSPEKTALEGEAYLVRAYNMFMLVNLFCHSYNQQYLDTDLGLFYPTKAETKLNPKGTRGSLADAYKKIEKDLLEGLAKVNDTYYKQPKFHFNRQAALAFASRFYLFTQQWDKVVEVSNQLLGSDPLRYVANWDAINAAATSSQLNRRARAFTNPENASNFLMYTPYAMLCTLTSLGYYDWTLRYNHTSELTETDTYLASTPWGTMRPTNYRLALHAYAYPREKWAQPIHPYEFQITDEVAQTGFLRSVYSAFTGEEVLLNRMEAYAHLGRYEEALQDINLLVGRFYKNVNTVTEDNILNWFNTTEYSQTLAPTPKKVFHPDFPIAEDGKQEAYLQTIVHLKRIVLLNRGLRWFDVKRYGIEIERVILPGAGLPLQATGNILVARDPRRAIQIPSKILSAGMEPNPR